MPKRPRKPEPEAPGPGFAPTDPVVLAKSAARFDPELAAKAVHFARELDLALRSPDDAGSRKRERGR
jgi:hypothetical protein